MKDQNLFEDIGGMDAVRATVSLFYDKVITDDSVSHYFKNVDLGVQSQKLVNFIAYALGAPLEYSGKSMKEAHQHMNITEDHFSIVASHLSTTLQELGVQADQIDQVREIVMSTKKDIVNITQN